MQGKKLTNTERITLLEAKLSVLEMRVDALYDALRTIEQILERRYPLGN